MKPTPDELAQLRAAYPQGTPRIDYREMKMETETRAAPPDGSTAPDADLIALSFSSEQPVLRYDFWNDEQYYEVLDHSSAKSIDLSMAQDGLPFVASHRAYDADQQHGLVENVRLDGKKLRGELKMSEAQRSQEIGKDIRSGIRRKVSVGYIVGDEFTQEKGGADGIPVRRFTAWMPLEVSTVPIPADYSVGIGRAHSVATSEAYQRFLTLHSRSTQPAPKAATRSITVSDTNTAQNGADQNESAAKRIETIQNMAVQHKCEEKLSHWIRSGASVSDVTTDINKILSERLAKPVTTSRGIELDEKTYKRFSFARALIMGSPLETEFGRGVDFGLEREIVEEARKSTPSTGKGSTFIPLVSQRGYQERTVDSLTATNGGAFKFTQPGDFIELLRNATSVLRAGATILPGLTGPVAFPKQTGPATGVWLAQENPGGDITPSDLTTSTVSLAMKTVMAASKVSRQALIGALSGNYDLEGIIRSDLAKVIALTIDLGALSGPGTGGQPLGILSDTSVGAAPALGAQGGTMAWGNWVDLETAVGDANADASRAAYITNTKQRGVAKKTAILGNTASGVPIWTGTVGEMDGIVNGYRAIASNQVSRTLVKGTVSTCSGVVFGAFENLMVGMFGSGFEVQVDPYKFNLQNLIQLIAWNFVDVANRYPVAFSTLKDAL